jgi:hypothetical protein
MGFMSPSLKGFEPGILEPNLVERIFQKKLVSTSPRRRRPLRRTTSRSLQKSQLEPESLA